METIARTTRHLSRIAVSSGGNKYTYGKVLHLAEDTAAAVSRIISKGPAPVVPVTQTAGPPPRIGVYATPGVEYLAATWAVWQAGGIVVPLATSHPPAELAYCFQDAGLSAVLVPEANVDKVSEVAAQHNTPLHVMARPDACQTGQDPATASSTAGSSSSSSSSSSSTLDRGALIIYTSGTTGKPKGVLHTHRSLGAQINSLVSAWQWAPSDRLLHTLPLHHIHGIVNALYCPTHVGAQVEFTPKFSPSAVWRRIMDGSLSVFMGVPTMYSYLLSHYDNMAPEQQEAARKAAASLRLTVSGSSACPVPIMERWKELSGSYLLERYGMTEIGMALSNPYEGLRQPGSVGMPLPGVSVQIADDGELLVRGDTVFKEYWGRPAATQEAFDQGGWFRTGDTAAVSQEGYYSILGRTSVDIIKSGGYKLSALQIESAVLQHPGVAEVAVVGLPDEVYGEEVTAVVARKPSHASLSDTELLGFCRQLLASYQVPRKWIWVDQLPRNAMGKVNKKELVKGLVNAGK